MALVNGYCVMLLAPYQQLRACFVVVFDEVGHVAATTRPYEEEEARKMGLPGGLVEEGEALRGRVIREAAEEGWCVEGVDDTPFQIENRYKRGRDQALPDSGLAIWHVDELGSNSEEQMKPGSHHECAREQADGLFDLEHSVNNGDGTDLYPAGVNDRFSDSSSPASKWWDGTPSGLEISGISAAGQQMTVSVDIP